LKFVKQVYEQLGVSAVQTVPLLSSLFSKVQTINCPPQMTLLQAAFASPSTLRFAHAEGLPLEESARLQRAAGFFADQNTLQVAYELPDSQCTGSIVNGIAASGCLHKMSFVRTHYPRQILNEAAWYAAGSGSIDMLKVLQQEGIPVLNVQTMRVAERHGHVEVYRHLHLQLHPEESVISTASMELLQWIRDRGEVVVDRTLEGIHTASHYTSWLPSQRYVACSRRTRKWQQQRSDVTQTRNNRSEHQRQVLKLCSAAKLFLALDGGNAHLCTEAVFQNTI
jgi:hypothetical protein